MGRLKLRRFANPSVLRRIEHANLVALLASVGDAYLRAHGVDLGLPQDSFDYDLLAVVLGTPDTDFPSDLADILHHVAEMSDHAGMDHLFEVGGAHLAHLVGNEDVCPEDVAVHLLLKDRAAFERAIAERMVARPSASRAWTNPLRGSSGSSVIRTPVPPADP